MTRPDIATLRTWPHWLVLLLLTFAPAFAAAVETIPPGKAVIILTPKFGPVTFSHQHHAELPAVQCVTCHHTLGTASETIQSCYGCHKAKHYSIGKIAKPEAGATDAEPTAPQIRDAQRAFHDLCIGCHKRQRAQGQPTGPDDSCRDCHK